jgi:hypothetical protein
MCQYLDIWGPAQFLEWHETAVIGSSPGHGSTIRQRGRCASIWTFGVRHSVYEWHGTAVIGASCRRPPLWCTGCIILPYNSMPAGCMVVQSSYTNTSHRGIVAKGMFQPSDRGRCANMWTSGVRHNVNECHETAVIGALDHHKPPTSDCGRHISSIKRHGSGNMIHIVAYGRH